MNHLNIWLIRNLSNLSSFIGSVGFELLGRSCTLFGQSAVNSMHIAWFLKLTFGLLGFLLKVPLANPAHGVTTATTQYQKAATAAMYGSHAGYSVG